jgi:hypothetical protein
MDGSAEEVRRNECLSSLGKVLTPQEGMAAAEASHALWAAATDASTQATIELENFMAAKDIVQVGNECGLYMLNSIFPRYLEDEKLVERDSKFRETLLLISIDYS